MNTETTQTPKTLTINTEAELTPKPVQYKPLPIHNDKYHAMHEPSLPFNFDAPQVDPVELATRLQITMKMYGGIGLAAVQCGVPLRVFALASEDTCFNPEIVSVSNNSVRIAEGCLSFPGLYLKIERPEVVTLRWKNERGEPKEQEFVGITARTILHELDHLNGVVFTSKVGGLTLQMAKKKRQKLVKKIKTIQAIKQRQIQSSQKNSTPPKMNISGTSGPVLRIKTGE